jgi:hypothetical protein
MGVVRGLIGKITLGRGLIVVAQKWPCWLPVVWGLRMPVTALYASTLYRSIFMDGLDELGIGAKGMGCTFQNLQTMAEWPDKWQTHCVLVSGSLAFCKEVVGKLSNHFGPYLYVVDMDFIGLCSRQIAGISLVERPNLHEKSGAVNPGTCTCGVWGNHIGPTTPSLPTC